MAFKIIHELKADSDLEEICEYLSQFYASTSVKFLDKYYEYLETVAFSPWFRRWKMNPKYRVFNVNSYMVFFKIDESTQTVHIHRILHGMRKFVRNLEVMEKAPEYHTGRTTPKIPWTPPNDTVEKGDCGKLRFSG